MMLMKIGPLNFRLEKETQEQIIRYLMLVRCRANFAHIGHSRPDSGLDLRHFQAKDLQTLQILPSSIGSGRDKPKRSPPLALAS